MQRHFKFLRIILNHNSALYEFIKGQPNPGTFQTHWSEGKVLIKLTIISQIKVQHSSCCTSMHGCSSQLIQPPAGTAAPERPEHIKITSELSHWILPLSSAQAWLIQVFLLPEHSVDDKGQSTFLVWKLLSFCPLSASQLQECRYDPRQANCLPQPGNINRVSGKPEESKWWVSPARQVIPYAAKCITRIYAPLFQKGHRNSFISMKQYIADFFALRFSEHHPSKQAAEA